MVGFLIASSINLFSSQSHFTIPRLPLIMIWEASFSCENKMLGTRKIGIYLLITSLQAGSRWSTSALGKATTSTSSTEAARQESEPALISANFPFPPRELQKKYAN